MSTWGTTSRTGFFFTSDDDDSETTPWFRANAFLRGVQTRRNSPTVEQAKFIPMQQDLEIGYDSKKMAVIASLGLRAKDSSSVDLTEPFSRRHYILYRINDNWALRTGKFMFAFGLNGPDHITATRRGLGLDQGHESYNAEVSYTGKTTSSFLTLISSSPDEALAEKDSGLAISQNFFLFGKSRVGINLFSGEKRDSRRLVYGPSWTLSLTENLFLNSEVFGQSKTLKATGGEQNGYAMFHRLGYEAYKGVTPFFQIDRAYLDTSDANTRLDSYGGGVQWLPYPHLELTSFLGEELAEGRPSNGFGWLMIHVYL